MKESENGADGSFGPPLGKRPVWDAGSPDHECDCPGPPPRFYLPPPPRPYFLLDSECSENSTSHLDVCETVPVIDAEYQFSPAVPPLAIILTAALAVVVFLLIGTFLVLLKKRKMQLLFPRKSSPHSRCDAASANGVVYEDLTNVRPRMLSSHCPPGQTTLSSIEMMDVASYPGHGAFTPVFICSTSPVTDSFDSRELFNPVYEELSNGSGEGGETDSEGMPRGAPSEDEFAEDELSFGGEAKFRRREGSVPDEGSPLGSIGNDACRDADSSDSDDKCKFLENSAENSSLPLDRRDKKQRASRGAYFGGVAKRPKALHGKKVWRSKARSPLPVPPVACNEFHEGFLLKRILQIYPDVTGMGLQYSCGPGPPTPALSENAPAGGGRYGSPDAFARTHLGQRKPEIFSTFGPMHDFPKNQSQDSPAGSDSGYSNNTSGGKSSSKIRKEYGLTSRGENTALS